MWHWQAGMNAASANKIGAWLFLMWATSKPTSILAAAVDLSTNRTSAFADSYGADAAKAALESLQNADGDLFKAAWFHPRSAEILDALGVAINETVTGSVEAQAALDVAAGKITAILG